MPPEKAKPPFTATAEDTITDRQPFSVRGLVPFVPVAILCLVASVQIFLTRTASLTPWKGGGFGMFSTNDLGVFPTSDQVEWGARPIRVLISSTNGQREVTVSDKLIFRARRAAVLPSDHYLTDLARAIARIERDRGYQVSRVEIQVWRTDYEVESLAPRLELLRERTIDLGAPRQGP